MIGRCDLLLGNSAGDCGPLRLRDRMPHMPFVVQARGISMGQFVSRRRTGSVLLMAGSARNAFWMLKDLAAHPQFDAIVAVGDPVAHDLAA